MPAAAENGSTVSSRIRSTTDRLRGLHDVDVTITTTRGSVSGSILSCTRLSVWLIADDEDHVIPLDEIIDVVLHDTLAA